MALHAVIIDTTKTFDTINREAKNVDNHISSNSAGAVQQCVGQNHSRSLTTEIGFYNAAVLTTKLYRAETWLLYRKQVKFLEVERIPSEMTKSHHESVARLRHQRRGLGQTKHLKRRIHADAQVAPLGRTHVTHG
ncbi:hypothetical protein ElyMa_001374500 [Elysia marginata]|uniref:Uncharacterized protein n=1 Tax=Elysia marginata TaxID=1093978 RepID=A0AAV4IS75_9GAST|nr:hypothetical protein ElyMa_001374500 [Elysia marginata]